MILRVARHERDFTVIANSTLRDPDLSFRATGMLSYLLTQCDGWDINGRVLAGAKKEGRDAVYATLAELEAMGYLVRTVERLGDGTFIHVSTVFETRQPQPTQAVTNQNGSGSAGAGLNGSQVQLVEGGSVLGIRQPDPAFQEQVDPYQENQEIKEIPNKKDYQEVPTTTLSAPRPGSQEPPKRPSAKRQLPEDFTVTAEMREWAAANTPAVDIDGELAQFSDYHRSNANTKADWVSAWRTWMRNAKKWGAGSRSSWAPVDRTHRNPANTFHEREGGSRVIQRPKSRRNP